MMNLMLSAVNVKQNSKLIYIFNIFLRQVTPGI